MKQTPNNNLIQKSFTGIIKRHPDGFGFFIPEINDIPDIFIEDVSGVMTNDRVLARITGCRPRHSFKKESRMRARSKDSFKSSQAKKEKDENRWFGEILKILERYREFVVGRFIQQDNLNGYLVDQHHHWGEALKIPHGQTLNAKSDDMVRVKILQYPSIHQSFTGKVVQIIGSADDPLCDIKKVVFEHHIPDEFHSNIKKELLQIPNRVQAKDKINRKDLTSLHFITIDGITAKDFDDAIYVDVTSHGFHALIAIADVSYYVKPGTYIDKQAYQRGNSTYFPNYVIPMLPEKLSHGICSLNPSVERLAFVADLELSLQGDLLSTQFYEAVIKTYARTTYKEIQSFLDHQSPHSRLSKIKNIIFNARNLAKILLSQRLAKCSLDLDLSETHLTVDEDGYAVDIQQAKRLFSHRIIEELMLLANVAVANFLTKHKMPAIYRVHEHPDQEHIILLNHFLKHLGYQKKIRKNRMNQQVNYVLKQFKLTQYEPILHIMILRAMKQACYSAKTVGHFGLGFPHYTHSTSPIRRYSDLIVHRQLKQKLGLQSHRHKDMNDETLNSIGNHLSACEQRSVKAERQVMAIKKARLMENLISQSFTGVITSITRFGIFILLPEFEVDGLLRLSDLEKGSFIFDNNYLYLRSRRTNKIYHIGDLLRVVIDKVDVDSGKINFIREEKV